jgi:hypothetical protein
VIVVRGVPLVTWRRAGCRHRLLRVYLSPGGWQVVGEPFRERSDDWLARLPAHKRDQTDMSNKRKVPANTMVFPLDIDAWSKSTHLEVGCYDAVGEVPFAFLIEDVNRARDTRAAVERELSGI